MRAEECADRVRRRLARDFRGDLIERAPLALFTTFRIGGPADLVAVPRGWDDLVLLGMSVREEECPFVVLGRGSNVLVADEGFRGVVILMSKGMKRISKKAEGEVYVESGCDLNRLIKWCIEQGLGGLEELSGIPGSVGGAVRMNAGAFETCMGDRVKEVFLLRVGEGLEEVALSRKEAAFAYRRAEGVERHDIIYQVILELEPADIGSLLRTREEVLEWRRANQPLDQPSAGSVFRNPEGEPAGKIIDRCGLKGLRVGGAAVSPKHANFIVNLGGATASDVRELIRKVKLTVREKEGLELQEEIEMVGFRE